MLKRFIRGGGSPQVRGPFGLLLLTLSTFALIFAVLEPLMHDGAFILVSVPVIAAAWMYGLRLGLVAAAVGFIITLALQWLLLEGQPVEWLEAGGWLGFLAVGVVSAVVGHLRDVRGRLAVAHDEARDLAARLVGAQERQQAHIARELHDEIGQTLTGLKLQLEAAADSEQVSASRLLVAELMGRVSELTLELRPTSLDDLGLLPALRSHFVRYTRITGVRVHFTNSGMDRRFAPEVETTVYRAIQEAITNVAKHAGVDEAWVVAEATADRLSVRITDKGSGIQPSTEESDRVSAGLPGMHERAFAADGTLRIESGPEGGTSVVLTIPLAPAA